MAEFCAPLTGRIESLAYGPHGIARVGGKVYFIRQVAPGDEVEFAVREDHRSYAYGDLSRLLAAGPDHRTAPCPYLPQCGGCPWQQVEYAAQMAAKERAVRDLLARTGGLAEADVSPIMPSPKEYGYRRRLSLRVHRHRLGYFAAASHDLVPVDHCLLAAPELDGAIALAQEWVARLQTPLNRLEIAAADGRLIVTAQAQGPLASADAEASEDFLAATPRVAGLGLRGRRWRRAWGDTRLRVPLIDGDELLVRAGNFVQVNDAANALLIRVVMELAGCRQGDRVVDLFAGAGNLSVPVARRAGAVTAIERQTESVEDGRDNARRLGIDNLAFLTADVAQALNEWPRERAIDTVILDPPRGGAREAVQQVLSLAPRRVVYVSCNPATLARDLRILATRYRVERVQPIDFFPHTYHVETVAGLVLTGG